ncbi:hypothetical protein [Clostridium celatum]|nr:hypothetical protein [Clostridium celatum]MDU6296809.1 hypothetical protein [Clostridium celatum]
MEEKYIIEEGTREHKTPKVPNIQDYYDVNETEEERAERIYLYSEVK